MADSRRPWSKFFWSDWESDQALRQCSLAAQGLWMRMLCICAKADPRGYLAINGVPLDVTAIATSVSRPETEVAPLVDELERWGVFSRDRKGRIYSRRMIRDDRASNAGRKAKKEALLNAAQALENTQEKPRPSRVPSRGASPHKPEARSQNTPLPPTGVPPDRMAVVQAFLDMRAEHWPDTPNFPAPTMTLASEAGVYLDQGHSPDAVIAALRTCMDAKAGKREGPPTSLGAFRRSLPEKLAAAARAAPPDRPTIDAKADLWRARLRNWRTKGWWSSEAGPPPDQPGCQVPPHILRDFLETAA